MSALDDKRVKKNKKISVLRGAPLPLGSVANDYGVNFAIFSRNAWSVELMLYVNAEAAEPDYVFMLHEDIHRTGDIWHVFIKGVLPGWFYNYRISGPWNPEKGMKFNRNRLLLDPFSRAFFRVSSLDVELCSDTLIQIDGRKISLIEKENIEFPARSVIVPGNVTESDTINHFGPESRLPITDGIIYETHVRGFTVHPSSGVSCPGTYKGLIEKIPYLKQLGITTVELLPLFEFNENELLTRSPKSGRKLKNYWGYSTLGFFAPKEAYASSKVPGGQIEEFKKMVDSFHHAGIEVILDVVFNHTGEGDEKGPSMHMRCMENSVWYMLEDYNASLYKNYSGCGNTLNCNHPVVASFIIDCLRYWVVEMRIDGFRFDLASILCRDSDGKLLEKPPLIEMITHDPVLSDVKLIAEAWDAAGAWQVGSFPGGSRWSDWNGVYRDDVRRFWRGDHYMTPAFASRICGSEDIYSRFDKKPANSINFITCHDGFTLNDLVSYSHKHNLMNGEEGRDGTDQNYSFNYGVEGVTSDPKITSLRERMMRNFMATLFLSRGVPMICGGDEVMRTQKGNNNAYCQDNEISWYDWSLFDKNRVFFDFTAMLIKLRKEFRVLSADTFYKNREILWFDPDGSPINWNRQENFLGVVLTDEMGNSSLCILFNATDSDLDFHIPRDFYGKPVSNLTVIFDTARPELKRGKMRVSRITSKGDPLIYNVLFKSMAFFEVA